MYCVSGYPTPNEEVNLNTIIEFKKEFPKNLIGLSIILILLKVV